MSRCGSGPEEKNGMILLKGRDVDLVGEVSCGKGKKKNGEPVFGFGNKVRAGRPNKEESGKVPLSEHSGKGTRGEKSSEEKSKKKTWRIHEKGGDPSSAIAKKR